MQVNRLGGCVGKVTEVFLSTNAPLPNGTPLFRDVDSQTKILNSVVIKPGPWKASMQPQVCAAEFEICVSMTDLVSWAEGTGDTPEENARLQAIFVAIGGRISVVPIYLDYFESEYRAGRGDVHVYTFEGSPNSVVALDLYNDPEDQLDLVTVHVRCDRSALQRVRGLVCDFFNSADVQACMSQQSVSVNLRNAIDASKFPRRRDGSAHLQLQVLHYVYPDEKPQ